MADYRCLLCGDPQQPSEYMYRAASHLEDRGVAFERMDWQATLSASAFRDLTMDMEAYGPAAYDTTAIEERLDGIDFLVVHKAPVSASVLGAGSDLAVVGAARGGVENVAVDAAAERGVTVVHAPGRNANAVADYAIALALAALREIPRFVETTARGEWALEFDPAGLPRDVTNLTVGIVGFGNVGRRVAERWAGFGPDLLAYDPYVDEEIIRSRGATPVTLPELLEAADVLTLHVRLSDETEHLIGDEELALLDEDALLVNTARGGLVDTDALVAALEREAIGGAALDVFEEEPLPADHPLCGCERVWLTPHTAGSTRDAVTNGALIVAADLAAIIADEEPAHRLA